MNRALKWKFCWRNFFVSRSNALSNALRVITYRNYRGAVFNGGAVFRRAERRSRWNGTYRAKGKDRTYLHDGTRWKAFYRLTYIANCLKRRPGALRTNLNSKPPRYIDIRIAQEKRPTARLDKNKFE